MKEFLEDIEVQYELEGKGFQFYDSKGEFQPEKLTDIALENGYKWSEENQGWSK
jgi:hypothetical protein